MARRKKVEEVSLEKAFYIKTAENNLYGIAKSLKELGKLLEKAPIEVIKFHLRDGKNDFAAWVRDVFRKKRLAKEIEKLKKLNDFEVIKKNLVALLKKA